MLRVFLSALRQVRTRLTEVTRMEKIFKLIGKRGRTTVPFEIRMTMRIAYNSLVSYEMKDENTVILRKEKICDGCKHPDENEGSILEVVNSLTETEQKALHRYLTIKLSAKDRAECPYTYTDTHSVKPKSKMRFRTGNSHMRKTSVAVMR